MRHLLEFNQFEGQEEEIRECFIDLLEEYEDIDFKISEGPNAPNVVPKRRTHSVSIGFSKYCDSSNSATSEYDTTYKPVRDGQHIADIAAAGVDKMVNYHGMDVAWANISWVNAGEWRQKNPDKKGDGPGILERVFRHKDLADKYALPEFISKMGDRLRHIKIYVTKR